MYLQFLLFTHVSQQLWHPMLPNSLAGQSLCSWRHNPIRVELGRWESLQTLTQFGNKGEAGTRFKIPPWHLALNALCLSGSIMAGELEPENKRWQVLQAQTGEHNSPHIRYHSAAFQLLASNSTQGCMKKGMRRHVCPSQRVTGFHQSCCLDQIRKWAKVGQKNKVRKSAIMGQFH